MRFFFSKPQYLALGQLILALESKNLPINFKEKVTIFLLYINFVLSVTQLCIYSGISHA